MWRVNSSRVSSWRAWDGEVVVYDDLSGDTLKLDSVMSEIFRRLQNGSASEEALVDHLAAVLQLPATDMRLARLIEIALERLDHCGLIAAVPTSR
jgi:PqqD family protein of HPr-rel-A system